MERPRVERTDRCLQESFRRLTDNSITSYESLQRLQGDLSQGPGISGETADYLLLSGFTAKQIDMMAASFSGRPATGLKQHLNFLANRGSGDDFGSVFVQSLATIADVTQAEWQKKGIDKYDVADYLQYLSGLNPLLAMSTVLLYAESFNQARGIDAGETTMIGWFKNSVEKAVKIDKTAGGFFQAMADNALASGSLLNSFLGDWRREVQLNIAECLGVAASMAIHVQDEEKCAVLTSCLFLPVSRSGFRQAIADVASLADYGIYKEYAGSVLNYGQQPENGVLVPLFMSVVDIKRLFESYELFWNQATGGANGSNIRIKTGSNRSTLIELGDAARLIVRPQENPKAEARIDLEGGMRFQGLSLRVDRERGRQRLAADMGGADFEQAMIYAHEVGQLSRNGQIIMNYPQMVDSRGLLVRSPGVFYPSIMESLRLDIGSNIALVLALAMREGEDMDMRERDFYLHHSREYIDRQEYFANFEAIAKNLITRFR